ncbi:MAG: hypothetical protein ACLQBJ_13400 [Bryobacteraceae bacterium]
MKMHPAILTGLALLSTVVVGEVALRIAHYPANPVVGWKTIHDVNKKIDPAQFYSRSEVNQLGFRGQPIAYRDRDNVALLVGDSQVESIKSPLNAMPERLLEPALTTSRRNWRVFSIGAGGYGQDQELLGLEEYFSRYRANLVILWLTIGNDLWNNVFPSHSASGKESTPKPTYRLSGTKLIGPNRELGQKLFPTQIEGLLFRALYGDLHAYWERFLPPAYKPMTAPSGQYSEIVHTDEGIETEDSHWSLWLTPSSPRRDYSIALARALLHEMVRLCEAHGARFVILEVDRYSPASYAVMQNFPLWRKGARLVEKNGKYYRADSRQYFEGLGRVAAGFELATIPVTIPNHTVSADDPHLNIAGNSQVLRDLAQTLTQRGLAKD